MHLLVTLHPDDAPKSTEDIDRIVRATIPDPDEEPELFQLVKQHHIHGPCDVGSSVCLDKNGRCTKKFPKNFRKESTLGEDGYAEPARPDAGAVIRYANGKVAHNGFVVPYNPELLQELDAHCNVELCGGIRFVKYLYKVRCELFCEMYAEFSTATSNLTRPIWKSQRRRCSTPTRFATTSTADTSRRQKQFGVCLRSRCKRRATPLYACTSTWTKNACEVLGSRFDFLRRWQLSDLEADEPGISIDEEGRFIPEKSHLFAFFRLNQVDASARNLYYYQVPEHYRWDGKEGAWVRRRYASKTIGRLCSVDVRFSERFHLRLLLLNVKGPQSYDDLKKVGDRSCRTYAEACVVRGLARDDAEWDSCLGDAIVWKMPRQLRKLFVMILALNNPKDPLKLWQKYRDALSEDFVRRHNYTQEQAYRMALAEIALELLEYGKMLKDYPTLPQVFVSCGWLTD